MYCTSLPVLHNRDIYMYMVGTFRVLKGWNPNDVGCSPCIDSNLSVKMSSPELNWFWWSITFFRFTIINNLFLFQKYCLICLVCICLLNLIWKCIAVYLNIDNSSKKTWMIISVFLLLLYLWVRKWCNNKQEAFRERRHFHVWDYDTWTWIMPKCIFTHVMTLRSTNAFLSFAIPLIHVIKTYIINTVFIFLQPSPPPTKKKV